MKSTSWTSISRGVVRALFLLVGGAALLTACSDRGTDPTGISPQRPRMNSGYGCPQGATAQQCDEFNQALDHLRNSDNPTCQAFAKSAAQRDANGDYYMTQQPDVYGVAVPDAGVNGQVGLSGSTFGNNQLANTIAHEESHLTLKSEDSPSGNWFDNNAYMYGDTCGYGYVS